MMIPQTVRVITLTNKQTQTDRHTLLKTYTYHLLRYAIAEYVAGNDNVAVASDASRTSSTDSNLLTDSENLVRDGSTLELFKTIESDPLSKYYYNYEHHPSTLAGAGGAVSVGVLYTLHY